MPNLSQRLFHRYGTHRGLIRLWLATLKWKLGKYRPHDAIEWSQVQRLVFVCQGNICRSPYAHWLALKQTPHVASFGYATTSDLPANPVATRIASARGTSLQSHRTTDLSKFELRDGDLLLVMEDRHLAKLQTAIQGKNLQMALLGLWAQPPRALIYDPHHLSEAYFHVCYGVIESAVANITHHFLQAHPDAKA